MKKLYKFRKIYELEKHIGYKFKDANILVQSLIHESYSKSNIKQSNLEKSGKLVVKFMILRESLLKVNDLKILENIYSFEFL
jgi:dsRNA-specific ribonuclease